MSRLLTNLTYLNSVDWAVRLQTNQLGLKLPRNSASWLSDGAWRDLTSVYWAVKLRSNIVM